MKHTFGRGLRATGVSFEDRQDLPGAQELADQLHSGRNGLLPVCPERTQAEVCRLRDSNPRPPDYKFGTAKVSPTAETRRLLILFKLLN
jgi:hypothetical protein